MDMSLALVGTINDPDTILTEWRKAKAALDNAKAIESALRARVIETRSEFAAVEDHEGTENIDIGFGYKLKIVHALDYKLGDEADAALDAIEATGAEGKFIAERLVSWKPSLSVREYKSLDGEFKKIIDRALTIKPKAKTVTLVPPKA